MLLHAATEAAKYTIGGKATGLFKLTAAGIRVPPFAVLPAETFDAALQDIPATLEAVAERKQRLLRYTLPTEDQEQIRQLLRTWNFPEQAVVVRSSIADEDSAKDAFPGMMDSFLNLKTEEAVFAAIARCAASAYGDRAIAYRTQRNLTLAARPAVVLQQQVQPVASGVMFTTFPEYPQELAIHAVWGFGEGLVSGALEADEFYFLKKTNLLHRQVLTQKALQLEAQAATGLAETAVVDEQQELACLNPAQLQELYEIGTYLEQQFKHPQDVEFVVSEKQVYVVQSRPVTQAIPEVVVYDNSNIQESYCGVTTPLTFSFASRAYATVYRQTMQMLALPEKTIAAHEEVVTNLLGLVKGRIYYNINNWYKGLQLLPSFKQNKADMERMMGLEEPVDFVEDREKTTMEKLRLLPGLIVNMGRLLWAFLRLHRLVPAFHSHFRSHYVRFYTQQISELSAQELLTQKEVLDKELLQNWTTPIINDFYVMMTNGTVARRLKKAGITDTDEFLSRYLSGDQQIESTQPTRAMQKLAAEAWQQEELRQLIVALPDKLHEQVREQYATFYQEVENFIGQYGDRTVGELKLETQTMRLEPLIFYKYLRNYLTAATPPAAAAEEASPYHAVAEAELKALLQQKSFFFRKRVWKSLANLQRAIRYRESLRLERTRLFGMYRALYLEMGQRLVQQGNLASARDVFYLQEKEITKALTAEAASEVTQLVADRKIEFDMYRSEEVPSRVVVPSPPVEERVLGEERPGVLQGTGCFQGVVSGEVIVITDPGSDLNVAGKIVCALRTDPGWAALFPMCQGVLIEKGSSLSHSVILLRELGIPTIININGLTKKLQTGQRVALNGTSGEIKVLA